MDNQVVEVLLIEDNLQDAELTMRALRRNHLALHMRHLKDSTEALRYIFNDLAASPERASGLRLIILDLKMPKLNGLEVLRRIKEDERTKVIPTVVLTSSKHESDRWEAFRAGANSYVVKPVAFDQFMETVIRIGTYWLTINQSIE